MRTIPLLVAAAIAGSAATGIFTSYLTENSSEESLATFARIQNTNLERLLPIVSKSIAICGSGISSDSPNFSRYAKAATTVLSQISELRAIRDDATALKTKKAAMAHQMLQYLEGVSDVDFRTIATELTALSGDQKKQDCIVQNSLAELKKA